MTKVLTIWSFQKKKKFLTYFKSLRCGYFLLPQSWCCLIAQSCPTPWTARMPDFPVLHNLLELVLMCIESVMSSNHLILCHTLLLLPSIFPSIRVFSNESVLCIRWPKYWSFSFIISLSSEYLWLISFRIGWFDLLAVQRMLKSLLQHHSSKALILRHSAFFMVQL